MTRPGAPVPAKRPGQVRRRGQPSIPRRAHRLPVEAAGSGAAERHSSDTAMTMRRETPIRMVLAAVLLLPAAAGAQEGEWRQWAGRNRDFTAESTGLAERWPASGPPEIWSRPLGAGHSAILASGGRLFTMYRVSHGDGGGAPWTPREAVVALDAATGATLWEYEYASMNQDFDQGAGPHATPLLAGGRLFTVGSNKELHAFDPATGELLWSKNLVADFGAPPLLIRSMIKPGPPTCNRMVSL